MANINVMDLDFTGVESTNYIPEGIHTVRVKDAQFSKASTGSDQLEVTFETADGATRKMWYNLLPQALWKVKGFLEVLGIPCEGRIRLNTKSMIGKTCQITVENDENDNTKQVITRVSKITNAVAEAPYAAPAVETPVQQVMAQQPVASVAPTAPVQAQPIQQEIPQAAQAPQGNLPPWMQNAAPAGNAPQGNLPPWMTQRK